MLSTTLEAPQTNELSFLAVLKRLRLTWLTNAHEYDGLSSYADGKASAFKVAAMDLEEAMERLGK